MNQNCKNEETPKTRIVTQVEVDLEAFASAELEEEILQELGAEDPNQQDKAEPDGE